jgi:NitT/TauT family transport system substrate-binding protein
MVGAHRDFVRKHPVATKRALRAILKAADLCTTDPEHAARFIVSRGYSDKPDYAAQALREIPYARWRPVCQNTLRRLAITVPALSFASTRPV